MMDVSNMLFVFIGVMILGVIGSDAAERPPITEFLAGCHHFEGTVDCKNHATITPQATIRLIEADYWNDHDLLYTGKINQKMHHNNSKMITYNFKICEYTDEDSYLSLFFEFENICKFGDYYAINPSENGIDHFHMM